VIPGNCRWFGGRAKWNKRGISEKKKYTMPKVIFIILYSLTHAPDLFLSILSISFASPKISSARRHDKKVQELNDTKLATYRREALVGRSLAGWVLGFERMTETEKLHTTGSRGRSTSRRTNLVSRHPCFFAATVRGKGLAPTGRLLQHHKRQGHPEAEALPRQGSLSCTNQPRLTTPTSHPTSSRIAANSLCRFVYIALRLHT
jgi:hypothetical protein